MAAVTKLTDAEVKAIADEVLGREMESLAFESAEVRSGEDYDDTPSLFITANVGVGVPAPLEGDSIGRLRVVLQKALLERGEERFPYFRLSRADAAALDDHVTLEGA